MAISVTSGFQVGNVDPVDSRITVANQAARLGFSSTNVYEGLIVKAGSWYKYDGTSLGQGVEGVKETLKDNPELLDDIEIRLDEIKNG